MPSLPGTTARTARTFLVPEGFALFTLHQAIHSTSIFIIPTLRCWVNKSIPAETYNFLAFFVDLPGDQRNTASSHKESMRRTPPPMHPNTSGLQKQKRRRFATNQRRFSWWTDCNARRTLFFMFRHIRFCSAFHLHERFYDRVYFFFIPLCQLYEIKPSFCKRPTTMPSSISHLLAK